MACLLQGDLLLLQPLCHSLFRFSNQEREQAETGKADEGEKNRAVPPPFLPSRGGTGSQVYPENLIVPLR
jgi:hypothetical protein